MLDHIISKVILGWLRHLIGAAGGALVGAGLFDQDQSQQFQGALMILVPLLFSAYDKWSAQQKANQAILATAKVSAVTGSPTSPTGVPLVDPNNPKGLY